MFKPSQTPASLTPISFCSPWFDEYVITLPEDSAPVLKDRLFAVLMHKLYNVRPPHDMSPDLLINLHDLLTDDMGDDELHQQEHLLTLDELQLSVLKRFCRAERQLAAQHRPRMNRNVSNHAYWLLLGDLIDYCEHPCRLQKLSFFA